MTRPGVPELLAAVGPRVRTSPFFDATVEAGLRSVSTYNHMWLPMGYGDPDAEYERLTSSVAMWDVAAQRHVRISGTDADRLVQDSTIVDVTGVEEGGGTYAPMLDHDGVLVNDPVLFRFPDGSWRFSIADSDVRLWLAALARERDLSVDVSELDTATLAVQGPAAWSVAAELELPDLADTPRFHHVQAELAGVDVRVSHSGWSAQGGFEVFVDHAERALDVWAAVRTAGRPYGIGPGAPNASERIENVLLSYGTDTGYDAHPDEIGLADLVDLDHGGDFIGRSAVVERRRGGIDRRLLGVVIGGDEIGTLPRPVPFVVDGDAVGELRAAANSPRFGVNLGLALVRRSVPTGADGRVELPEGRRSTRLVPVPFDGADCS